MVAIFCISSQIASVWIFAFVYYIPVGVGVGIGVSVVGSVFLCGYSGSFTYDGSFGGYKLKYYHHNHKLE